MLTKLGTIKLWAIRTFSCKKMCAINISLQISHDCSCCSLCLHESYRNLVRLGWGVGASMISSSLLAKKQQHWVFRNLLFDVHENIFVLICSISFRYYMHTITNNYRLYTHTILSLPHSKMHIN